MHSGGAGSTEIPSSIRRRGQLRLPRRTILRQMAQVRTRSYFLINERETHTTAEYMSAGITKRRPRPCRKQTLSPDHLWILVAPFAFSPLLSSPERPAPTSNLNNRLEGPAAKISIGNWTFGRFPFDRTADRAEPSWNSIDRGHSATERRIRLFVPK